MNKKLTEALASLDTISGEISRKMSVGLRP